MGDVTRVVCLPVREVAGSSAPLWEVFRRAWRLSTDLANWAQRELALRDVRRTPDMTKLPPFDPKAVYGVVPRRFPRKASRGKPARRVGEPMVGSLYDLWNSTCPSKADWAGATASAQCVLRSVEHLWKNHPRFGRFAVMWEGKASACVYRFPFPWEVHRQDLLAAGGPRREGGQPCVSLGVPGGRVFLRLAAGPEFRRQLAQFDLLCRQPERLRSAKVTARYRAGKLVGADLRLVGTFPVAPRGDAPNVCFLHTDPNALLVAEVNGRRVTVTNGDHLKRALAVVTTTNARHKAFLARVAQDKKREVRMDAAQRKNLDKYVAVRCQKMANRLHAATNQIAAQVARFCQRQGVGVVAYDDAGRDFIPCGFDWSRLKSRIQTLVTGELSGEWIDGQFAHLDEKEKGEWLTRARALLQTAPKVAAHKSRPRRKSHPAVSPRPATSAASGRPSSTTSSPARSRARRPTPSAAPAT